MITCLLAESRQAVEGCQQFVQCLLQLEVEFLIGIQTQNPITGCLVDSGVFLRSVALPLLDEDFRAERLRDRNRAVRRARVDDDDFSLAVVDERLHAGERAAEVGLYVESNNDDGKVHKWNAAVPNREFVRGLEIVSQRIPLLSGALDRKSGSHASSNFGKQKYDQDNQLRLDGMPVAGVRKHEVIDRRVRQHKPREKPCSRPLLAQRTSQSPESQYRRCQECRGAEVHWSNAIGSSRNSVPIVEEPLQADDHKARRVRADPVERHPFAGVGVREFAHALKLLELESVEIGLQISHEHAVGVRAVAQTDLQSEIITEKYKASEDFVSPHDPRRQHQKEHARSKHNAAQRRQPAAVSLPPNPEAAEG